MGFFDSIFGGGSTSSTSTTVTSKNIVESLAKTMMNCSSSGAFTQSVTIIGNYNVVKRVRMVQGIMLSSSCASEEKNVSETQNAVINAIKQAASSQSDSILGALTKSDSSTNTRIENEVRSVINRESIMNIVNSVNATQQFYLNGNSNIVDDITFDQSMQLVYDSCQSTLTQIKSFQQATTSAESSATSTQTNVISDVVKSVTGFFTNLGMMGTLIFIVFIVAGVFLAYKFGPGFITNLFGSSDAESSSQANNQYYQYQSGQYANQQMGPMQMRP